MFEQERQVHQVEAEQDNGAQNDGAQSNGVQDETKAAEQPWSMWEPLLDLDVWIATHDRDLQLSVRKNATGYGSMFRLTEGGDIYMHTTSEGDVLLDVTPEAEWVAPVITAATGVAPPRGQIWVLPSGAMMPLLMGLSSLIAASRIVLQHDYKIRKSW